MSALKSAITAAGYTPLDVEVTAANVDEDAARKTQETRSLWQRFIVSALFAVPLLYLAMGPMIPWLGWRIPAWLSPMDFPLRYALVEMRTCHPEHCGGLPLLHRGIPRHLAPGSEHGFAHRHGHIRGHHLQPLLDLAHRTGFVRRRGRPVLRDRRRHHHAHPAGQVAGIRFQGAHVTSHQEAHGPCAQDCHRRAGRPRGRTAHRRSGGRRSHPCPSGREGSRWTARSSAAPRRSTSPC